jgi:hypothetical protein
LSSSHGSKSGANLPYRFGTSQTSSIHGVSEAAEQALPPAGLVLVATDAFGAGNLNVVEEDRVEHLLGDDSTQAVLGVVAVS